MILALWRFLRRSGGSSLPEFFLNGWFAAVSVGNRVGKGMECYDGTLGILTFQQKHHGVGWNHWKLFLVFCSKGWKGEISCWELLGVFFFQWEVKQRKDVWKGNSGGKDGTKIILFFMLASWVMNMVTCVIWVMTIVWRVSWRKNMANKKLPKKLFC